METPKTILLVEDNDDDVLFMRCALRDAGIHNPLQVLEDGAAAVRYLAGAGEFADRGRFPLPAVVFLDLKLPYKSGHSIITWTRQQAALTKLPIIVLTSSDEPSDLRRAYEAGANSYLIKPPTADQIRDLAKGFAWNWICENAGTSRVG